MNKKRMFLTALSVCLRASLSLLPGSTLAADQASSVIEKEFPARSGQQLVLDLKTGGDVFLRGWKRETVSIVGEILGEDVDDCGIDTQQIKDGLRLNAHCAGRNHSYSTNGRFEIRIPERFDVQIDSAGGEIEIRNVEGSLSAHTGGGEITVADSAGGVRLSTGGGDIRILRSNLDGVASTGAGDVMMEEVSGDITASTGSGEVKRSRISTQNVKPEAGAKERAEIRITKAGGSVELAEAPNGARIDTGGGDIHVRSAGAFVEAQTGGGNISLDSVAGGVAAMTGAGDIRVQVVDGFTGDADIDIVSGSGDVTLLVPAEFSMDLHLEVAFTKERKEYDIISDFPLKKEKTSQWDDRHGTPRKYLYGTGRVSGGRNKVRIETVNGRIYLKKA